LERNTQILSFGLIILLTVSGVLIGINLNNSDDNSQDNDLPDPTLPFFSLKFEDFYYISENITFELIINTSINVTINTLNIYISDYYSNRIEEVTFDFNQLNISNNQNIPLTFSPIIENENPLILSSTLYPYTVSSYKLNYNTSSNFEKLISSSYQIKINEYPSINRALNFNWTKTNGDLNLNQNYNQLSILSNSNTTFEIYTILNATGCTYISLGSSSNVSELQFSINDTIISPINDRLEIGIFKGINVFKILSIQNHTQEYEVNFNMTTRKIVLFSVIADNNWETRNGQNDTIYFSPVTYLKQSNYHFLSTFNLSIIYAKTIKISTPTNTNLFEYYNQTIFEVGSVLNLEKNKWHTSTGSTYKNSGFDLLLVFTNKTMSNLGVVYGNQSGPFNVALHSQGSLNGGNFRLPPNFSDNLFQHEISHIFGAPDRFTSTSSPSVMTKSLPEDIVQDILFGRYWLNLNNWLEVDIQTMYKIINSFRNF